MEDTEEKIIRIIDENREEILAFAKDIYTHAELGYKEFRTAEKFARQMKKLGLDLKEQLAVTGVKAYLNPQKKKTFSLALLGELDALRIPKHKYANPENEAAHCCGHHAQLAGVVGAAMALSVPEISEKLDGQVIFFATPAEEYGEVEFKERLRQEGKIKYGGGKCELIRIGAFDDIELCLAHHSMAQEGIGIGNGSNNGFVSKVIQYHGKAAHAAGSPQKGINALSAASLGLQALGLNRETFRDQDAVRVHPIMTKGGNLVNVIPDEVVLETLVRAKTIESIQDASKKTDRSFCAGAMAVGAKIEIRTLPGYLPMLPVEPLEEFEDAAKKAAPGKKIRILSGHSGGSTDVGDVQHLMPVYTFRTGGVTGDMHQADFDIIDEEEAYIETAKIFAITAYRLLKENAKRGRELTENYHPYFASAKEYVNFMDQFDSVKKYDYKGETL
ncbi:MAG: amidohydrolase [Suilimivivens sp.]